jgi:hypothetical protein
MRGILRLAEDLFASQEGLCSMEVVIIIGSIIILSSNGGAAVFHTKAELFQAARSCVHLWLTMRHYHVVML